MFSFQNITLYFGSLHLLDNISFVISPGEKLALIGKNGAGKTTLFKVITGEISPDEGQISTPNNSKIGYLSQHLDFAEDLTIKGACLEIYKEYFDLELELDNLHQRLESVTDENAINDILERVSDLEIKRQSLVTSNPLSEIAKILKGLGFREDQFDDKVATLSGGWQMRVQIAKLLLYNPDLLLLDEPDNHLDIEALIWFEKYIKAYKGAVLFISHDTEFMSNTANRILELANRKIFDYKGSYTSYIDSKELRAEKEEQSFINQQKLIKAKEKTINRFMAKATKTKMAQSMQKQLDKIERIELESEDITNISISFPVTKQPGKLVSSISDVTKSYGDLLVLDKISMEIERGQKIAFVGQNGQGKSTLVKLIADKIKANSGNIELGHNVILSYFAQNQSETLDDKLTVLETLESQSDPEFYTRARKTLGAFAFSGDDVHKKVSVLSGGEKSRLAMACLVSKKSNFLILDEPTNHLDIHSKAILKTAIVNYPGTLIIVSHDREILKGSVELTYEFRDKKIIQHLGDLEYVLNKRNTEDLRSFEKTQESDSVPGDKTPAVSKLDYNERKTINRNISRIEKNIDKLESKIKEIHTKLLDVNFFNSPDAPDAMKKLKEYEESLEKDSKEWDHWVSQLD